MREVSTWSRYYSCYGSYSCQAYSCSDYLSDSDSLVSLVLGSSKIAIFDILLNSTGVRVLGNL